MVNLEFERPGTWSLGQKAGALGLILMVLGPFLPYWTRLYSSGQGDSVIYADVTTFGLLFLIPLTTAMIFMLLLFFKLNIFILENGMLRKVNHIIIIALGSLFGLIYVIDAIRAMGYSTSFYSQFAGIGLIFIIMGYFLCTLAGYLEWQKPYLVGPQILIKRIQPVPEVSTNGGYPINTSEEITLKPTTTVNNNEKAPQTWSNHVSGNGKTIEQCRNCGRYTFFTKEKNGDAITFRCSECKTTFTLN
jgi:hypothetical protein